jgi:signal transduction histidine kinase
MRENFVIFLLYLFYGGAFFAIGVSITSRDTKHSGLKIARFLWILALFAYVHAFHEWFELFLKMHPEPFPESAFLPVNLIKLVFVLASFCFLLLFGVSILQLDSSGKWTWLVLLYIVLVGAVLVLLLSDRGNLSEEYFRWADYRVRNLVGLPGALLSGLGFILYSRTIRDVSVKGAFNFIGAGSGFLLYGFFTGALPSGTVIGSAGIPVELFRGLCAVLILYFVMHALYTFDEERKAVIEERLNRFAHSERLTALGRLAAGIAHEINNPLANVSLNLEMIKRDLDGRGVLEGQQKRMKAVEKNLDRVSQIARELLHISSGREGNFEETDLKTVAISVLNLLGPSRREYSVSVDLDGVNPVSAVPWKMEEVFLNLFLNAMDATPPGGTISVTGFNRGGRTLVQISDSGAGIAPEDLNRVMDPFFTTKEVGQGTGLGLSICYGIMQAHNGDITITSEPGRGTTVTLSFPKEAAGHDQDPGS